jgi:predicted HAD superfamily Cof-like phosphohydrolase
MNPSQEPLQGRIDKVLDFHRIFQLHYATSPEHVSPAMAELRHRLMAEENDEYLEACRAGDMAEIADALGDKLYILLGTIITHGMQHKIFDVFDEIHRSNLSKLDAEGKPIFREDGKIMKGPTFFRPDIRKVLGVEK